MRAEIRRWLVPTHSVPYPQLLFEIFTDLWHEVFGLIAGNSFPTPSKFLWHIKNLKRCSIELSLLYNPTYYGRVVSMSNCQFALCWIFSFFFFFSSTDICYSGGSTTVYQTWRVFNVVASSRWLFLRYRANMSSSTLKNLATRLIDRIDAIYEQLSDYTSPWQFLWNFQSAFSCPANERKTRKFIKKKKKKTMAKLVCIYILFIYRRRARYLHTQHSSRFSFYCSLIVMCLYRSVIS